MFSTTRMLKEPVVVGNHFLFNNIRMERVIRIITVVGVITTAIFLITTFLEENELVSKINNLAKAIMMFGFVVLIMLLIFRPLKNKKQE